MGVISLADVKPAPWESVALYNKYRGRIAQVGSKAEADKLRKELLDDSVLYKRGLNEFGRYCVDEIILYLLRRFEDE